MGIWWLKWYKSTYLVNCLKPKFYGHFGTKLKTHDRIDQALTSKATLVKKPLLLYRRFAA